jgi:hypothetical protein
MPRRNGGRSMMHLYEIKENGDHYWEVFKDDPITPWNDNFVEYLHDHEFVTYHANLMSLGLDFCIHFYDEDVQEYHLVLEPERLVKA